MLSPSVLLLAIFTLFLFSSQVYSLNRVFKHYSQIFLCDVMTENVPTVVPQSLPAEQLKIPFPEWLKIELRVGLIELVEEIVGKDKLYKLSVDFATEKRTIVAGLKPYFAKEELQGKKAVFVFNLAPAKLAGIESNGMILAAKNVENKYKVFFADDSVPIGTRLE
jgi:methionine--tRNA ligase beta chain